MKQQDIVAKKGRSDFCFKDILQPWQINDIPTIDSWCSWCCPFIVSVCFFSSFSTKTVFLVVSIIHIWEPDHSLHAVEKCHCAELPNGTSLIYCSSQIYTAYSACRGFFLSLVTSSDQAWNWFFSDLLAYKTVCDLFHEHVVFIVFI